MVLESRALNIKNITIEARNNNSGFNPVLSIPESYWRKKMDEYSRSDSEPNRFRFWGMLRDFGNVEEITYLRALYPEYLPESFEMSKLEEDSILTSTFYNRPLPSISSFKIAFPEFIKNRINIDTLYDRYRERALRTFDVATLECMKILGPERFDREEKNFKWENMKAKLHLNPEDNSKYISYATLVAQARILFPEEFSHIKISNGLWNDILNSFDEFLSNDYSRTLEFAYRLGIIAAEDVKIDEQGMHLTFGKLSDGKYLKLPERRKF